MSMFLVGRHTRAEEETGRDELLRAAAVGRAAPTTAAVLVGAGRQRAAGALVAVSLVAYAAGGGRTRSPSASGSTLCGLVFTGTGLVAAQLTASTRAMYGIAGAVIASPTCCAPSATSARRALTWLSPIGWYQAMHAFSGLRWWPLLLLAGRGGAGRRPSALRVFGRRDFGAGVLADAARAGHARPPLLGSALGLAWRLQRGSVVGWAAGHAPDRARLRLDRATTSATSIGDSAVAATCSLRAGRHRGRLLRHARSCCWP